MDPNDRRSQIVTVRLSPREKALFETRRKGNHSRVAQEGRPRKGKSGNRVHGRSEKTDDQEAEPAAGYFQGK